VASYNLDLVLGFFIPGLVEVLYKYSQYPQFFLVDGVVKMLGLSAEIKRCLSFCHQTRHLVDLS